MISGLPAKFPCRVQPKFLHRDMFQSQLTLHSALLGRRMVFLVHAQPFARAQAQQLTRLQLLVLKTIFEHLFSPPSRAPRHNPNPHPRPQAQPSRPSNGAYRPRHTEAPQQHARPPRRDPDCKVTKAYADVVDVLQQPALASGNNFKKMQFESRKADFHAAYAELLRVRQTGGQSAEAEVAFARASKHLRLHLHPDKAEAGEQKLFNEATQRLGQLEAVLLRKESE